MVRLRLRAAWLALTAKGVAAIAVTVDRDGVPDRVRGVYVFPPDGGGVFGGAAMGALGSPQVGEFLVGDTSGEFDVRLTRPHEPAPVTTAAAG